MGKLGVFKFRSSNIAGLRSIKKFINEKNKKIILITGVAGMLGSELTSKLIKKIIQ